MSAKPKALSSATTGPATLGALTVGYLALWLVARPAGQPAGRFAGEFFGAHGLFVASAAVHAAIVDPVLRRSTVLRSAFLAVGAIGVAAYAYPRAARAPRRARLRLQSRFGSPAERAHDRGRARSRSRDSDPPSAGPRRHNPRGSRACIRGSRTAG